MHPARPAGRPDPRPDRRPSSRRGYNTAVTMPARDRPAEPGPPPVALHLLGTPRLLRDGAEAVLANAKGVALLGYLALRRDPLPRDQALGLLWPESAPEAARKNLRNTLWAIRQALGPGAVAAAGDRLALGPDTWADARVLDAGAGDPRRVPAPLAGDPDALAGLWRGPFLDGLAVHDAAELELWLAAARERLAARHLRVLAAVVDARRRAGDWPAVAAAADRGLAVDPLHEPLHRAQVEALVRLGQRAEAARRHAAWRHALQAELGVAPLPETEAAIDALLHAAPADRPDAAAPRPSASPVGAPPQATPDGAAPPAGAPSRAALPVAVPRPPAGVPPFVGRADARAALTAAAGAAAAGGVRVALVTGEAGIGKSRLWQAWSADLAAPAVAAATRALETNRALPLVPVMDLLAHAPAVRAAVRPTPDAAPRPPAWLADLAPLLPDPQPLRPASARADLPVEEGRRRLFEAATQAVRAAGGAPLVLFVDDAHWADDMTLDWLGYLVHRRRGEPMLVVLAYRPEEAPAALRRLAADWVRQAIAAPVPLSRLADADADALLAALGVDPGAAPALRAKAHGNPLFLTELARAGAEPVPPVLAETVRSRLAGVPDAARQVLQAAAVLGGDADFQALRRVAGRGEDETLDAIDALVSAAVLTEHPDGSLAFTHPLVADIVRQGLGAARRAVLHRRAAEALAARAHTPGSGLVAARVAEHYAAAGLPAAAAASAALAAERAADLAAPGEAAALYARAAELDPTPERQLALARGRIGAGDIAGARAAFEAARAGFAARGDARSAAQACLGLAGSYLGTGQPDRVAEWTHQALAHLEGVDDPDAAALAQVLLAADRQDDAAGLAAAEARLLTAARLAREHGLPHVLAGSQFELGNLRARQGDVEAARAAFREAIVLARAAGDRVLEALGHNNAAHNALAAGDLPDARAHLAAGLSMAEAADLAAARQWLYSVAGELALAEARWDDAEGWLRRARDEARRRGNPEMLATVAANLGRVAAGRGRPAEAARLLAEADAAAARLQSPFLQAGIDLGLAEVEWARGERGAAAAALARAAERLRDRPFAGLRRRAARLAAEMGEGTGGGEAEGR